MNRPISPDLLNAVLRTDFYSFFRAVFPIVSTSGPFLPNWHVQAIAHALEQVRLGKIRRLLITVPPRYLKSLLASVALPAYLLGHDPTSRIICVSYSDALARAHANDCRAVMGSDRYRAVFPNTRISPRKDTETEVKTTARGFRYATSIGGTLTGRGGDILIIDDPQKPQDAHSEIARASVESWFYNTLYPRLDSKTDGAIIVVMQRLHPDDLVGKLLEQGGWTHLNVPAIAQHEEKIPIGPKRYHTRRPGDVLQPEREPLSSLLHTKRGMGSMDFEAQYQQSPVSPEGNLIRWGWFQFYDAPPYKEPNDRIIISWDTASSAKELSSYSVGIVAQVQGESVYILDVIRDQLEYPDLRRRVIENHNRWKYACNDYALLIEDKGSGMSLIQDLKQLHKIHPVAIRPTGEKEVRMSRRVQKLKPGRYSCLARQLGWENSRKSSWHSPADAPTTKSMRYHSYSRIFPRDRRCKGAGAHTRDSIEGRLAWLGRRKASPIGGMACAIAYTTLSHLVVQEIFWTPACQNRRIREA